jgi:Mlc titration factor MtfA (ptsG expression regulator)
VFSWFKKRRRDRIAAPPLPEAWAGYLKDNFQHWALLTDQDKLALEDIVQVLVQEKHWEGCGGLEVTEEMRVTIAAQAGLLLLGIDHDYYENVESILIYPSGYKLPRSRDAGGGVALGEDVAVIGSAHQGGPVLVAWDSARQGGKDGKDGRNLVYHEFAHKLDMLDGMVDGTPELEGRDEFEAWVAVMTEEFDRLREAAKKRRKTLLDAYGATDVAEFFAVATEVFFEKPVRMKDEHPRLYDVMQDFYHQDPASRMGRARG